MTENPDPTRVLMVDDEPEFLRATAGALRRRGLLVTVAGSGEEALQAAASSAFDVLLLDVRMPGMDGVELFRRLRLQRPDWPAIMLTGHGTDEDADSCAKAGVLDYLRKPCDLDDLARRIRDAAEAPGGDAATGKIQVLLVDDEEELLDSLRKVLERRGMRVHTAADGLSALERLGATPIDVVVLDVKMPGIDGLEVLRRIKQTRPTVEVLLLTGHPTVQAATDGLGLGARDYLVKPPDVDQLVELVRTAHEHRTRLIEKLQRDTVLSLWRRHSI